MCPSGSCCLRRGSSKSRSPVSRKPTQETSLRLSGSKRVPAICIVGQFLLVLPDRALHLLTFSHLLIVNKLLSLSLSHSLFLSLSLSRAIQSSLLNAPCLNPLPVRGRNRCSAAAATVQRRRPAIACWLSALLRARGARAVGAWAPDWSPPATFSHTFSAAPKHTLRAADPVAAIPVWLSHFPSSGKSASLQR